MKSFAKQLICNHIYSKRFGYLNTPYKQHYQECLKCGKINITKEKQNVDSN